MAGRIDARLKQLGITLPDPPAAQGSYAPWVITGKHVYIAGQGAFWDGKLMHNGRLGDTVSLEDGIECARIVGLNLVAQLKAACGGDLDRVVRCVKLTGFVQCTSDFTEQPKVINGTSDLMVEIFGEEAGKHARMAVGAPALPMGISVEVDAVFEIA